MPLRERVVGLTLVELLVVLAVMGLLLGLMTAYFASQTHATEESQAQNNVRVKVRSVGELLTQDLEMAGALAVYDATSGQVLKATSTESYGMPSPCSTDRSGCVTVAFNASNQLTDLGMWYFTSLAVPGATSTGPCHYVRYHFDRSTGTLYRTDDDCTATPSGWTNAELAGGITGFAITFQCAEDTTATGTKAVDNPSDCFAPTGNFVQSAEIQLDGQDTAHGRLTTAQFDTNAPTPNLRKPPEYWVNPLTGG